MGLAALAAGGLATGQRAAARAKAAGAAFPPEGQILDVDGLAVHAVIRGTGPDLILLHGASGSLREFTFALIDQLVPDFRVIALDRPGLGHSAMLPGNPTALAAQADHLRKAVERLGVTRPLILCHSYGGSVALAWALDDPSVRGLALLGAPSLPWTTGVWWVHSLLGGAFGPVAAPLVAAWTSDARAEAAVAGIFAPDPVPEGYLAHVGAALTLRTATLRANSAQVAGLLLHITAQVPRYPGLTIPVELIHGTQDSIVPHHIHSVPLADILPNARLTLFDGGGHMPHHAQQAEVLAAIHRLHLQAGA
jgi:pimeloyl-ACP methyl ester carboxylesterase